MAIHIARPVVPRLLGQRGHPGGDHGGGGHGGGGDHGGGDGAFGGHRHGPGGPRRGNGDRPPGPPGPGPERPPRPAPGEVQDLAEGPFRVVRPADMLVVDISLVNLRYDGHRLVPRVPGTPAFVLAVLPPQHVVEQSFLLGSPLPPVPVAAVTAGPTTLAFSVPAGLDGLALSLEALLDWQHLVPLTVPPGAGNPDPAGSTVFHGVPGSVIEFPLRLLVTYDDQVDWLSRRKPHQADGRTALWHARLHGAHGADALLRAVAALPGRGFADTPLTARNLDDLVTLTSRTELVVPGDGPIDVPSAPLHAEQFIVTPLGASAHLHGAWDGVSEDDRPRYPLAGRPFPELLAYDHITALGRDQYLRVVTRGIMTSGHLAAHVHEFRRVFVASPNDGITAYLQQEEHVIIKQPEVGYGRDTGFPHAGREMPFRALRITDRVTPPIKPPSTTVRDPNDPRVPLQDTDAFWVRLLDGTDHQFTLIGTDSEGRAVSFKMPLIFIPDKLEDPEPRVADLVRENPGRMQVGLRGQVMAMAQPPAGASGSTSHAVDTLTFAVERTSQQNGRAAVRPHVRSATVRVPAVEQFLANAGAVPVEFDDTYLKQGMENHPAGAYLGLKPPIPLTVAGEQAGGVASPKTELSLITTQAGVVPDVFQTDPTGAVTGARSLDELRKAFGGARLLGKICLDRYLRDVAGGLDTLRELSEERIEAILNDPAGLLPAPVLRVRDLADSGGKELRYVWKTRLGDPGPANPGEPDAFPVDLRDAVLTLEARTVRAKDAVDQAVVRGRLNGFALDFFEIARVDIAELAFETGPGRKPEITASGVALTFEKDLEFINTLRDALPADVFGSGAYVDVDDKGVRAGYKFALPALTIGVFTLANVSLAAELAIPFGAEPVTFRFSVSEREHPFNVTVSLLGGGGYFSMLVNTTGVQRIEGAIEFGGAVALNLGVASGGVSIMAGIRFTLQKVEKQPDNVSLTGYLHCSGFLCVLGIVTVSVEFSLELTYVKSGHQSVVHGKGTLTVSVRIAFFSKSVTLELERSFSGAPCDPTFAECVPREPYWRQFCEAYAPQPHG
ncbi:hypothetical protein [Streptomyces sp. NPDC017086]|uniref:hypothetical protein n=1 Tax=Streptomyces sp. NPDC017086 TaxID=3364976 RepID=UPI0037BA709B